jgi:protein-S-isoprenylcysteine O-methyltransferase Ste14
MSMRWFQPKTLLATAGAVILPLLVLAYLASLPGKDSAAWVLLKVAIVVLGVVLFGLLLARLVEQMNAARVGRWLETDEGREWLESLPDDEREAFQERFDPFR